jgi:ABC-type antimicrobial peptide transport system permease subunit
VIIALGFSMAILISIPAGIAANQTATQNLTGNLSSTLTETQASINQTLTQVDCSLTPSLEGFGFRQGNFTPGQFGSGNFQPGQFGGGNFTGQGEFRAPPGEFGGGAFGGSSTPMNETLYSDINTTLSGVAAVAPYLQVSEGHNETVTRFGQSFQRLVTEYVLEGVSLTSDLVNNYPILPTNITSGRKLQAGETGVVLLSENNSAYFGIGVGGTVTILDNPFTVVGIHGTTGVSDRTTVYMSLSDLQSLTNNTGYITGIHVFATGSSVVTDVSTTLSALHPELSVVTAQQRLDALNSMQTTYNSQLEAAQATMNQTQSQAFQEIVIAVAATSLIVLFVMLYTVRERTKEIGTLKAIGFSNHTVMGQFMLEGILLSAVAGLVGVAIGTIATPFLSSILLPTVNPFSSVGGLRIVTTASSTPAVVVDPITLVIAFGASILLGALGSLYPAWRASRTRPAEAMRYE